MRMMRNKAGETLYRGVRVRVFYPGNKGSTTIFFRAPNRMGITALGIQQELDNILNRLEKERPGHVWRTVTLGPTSFNLVWESGPADGGTAA